MLNGFYIILFEFANSFAVQILHLGEVTQIRTPPQKINNNYTTNVATIGVSLYKGDSYSLDQTGYNLFQNYPNPFNPTTTINYSIKEDGLVKLMVFNLLGEEVAVLVNENKSAGNYTVKFNASYLPSRKGSALTSGIYFYRIQSGRYTNTVKMLFIK